MATTAVAVPGDPSPFAVLNKTTDELQSLVQGALGSDKLSAGDIKRIKIPGAGATSWEVVTLRGEESFKVLEGIVLRVTEQRGYWADEYTGGNDEPDCKSFDMVTGEGDPGGACDACPFNQWESAEKGKGKACKETRSIFLLRPGSILPVVVNVPPSSLKPLKDYRLALFDASVTLTGVVTKLALEKVQPEGVPAYAKLVPTAGEFLTPDEQARIEAYARLLMPNIERTARNITREENA